MFRTSRAGIIALAAGLGTAAFLQEIRVVNADEPDLLNTGLAEAGTFQLNHARWRAARQAVPETATLTIPLHTFAGLTSETLNTSGVVKVNLLQGSVRSALLGLPPGPALWDLWLIDNKEGTSTLPQSDDNVIRVGTYVARDGELTLNATLDAGKFRGFKSTAPWWSAWPARRPRPSC